MVAEQNAAEAALVPGVRVIAASSLTGSGRLAARHAGPARWPPAAEFEGGQDIPSERWPTTAQAASGDRAGRSRLAGGSGDMPAG